MRLLALALELAVLAGAAAACAGPPAAPLTATGAGGWPAGRTFVSATLTGYTLAAGTHVALTFRPDGSVSAYAGCNTLSGTGRVSGGRLIIGDIRQTQLGCEPGRMNQDEWLARFLTAKPAWNLAGDQLQLASDTVLLTLTDRSVTSPDHGLTGTRWVIDAITTGGTVASVPHGTGAYLTFDSAGHISGSTGCAPITGTAHIGSTTITVSSLAPAKGTCAPQAAAVDAAIRNTLRGSVGYTIQAGTLTLTNPDGHSLRLGV
jgi:heat shock protein HslJ